MWFLGTHGNAYNLNLPVLSSFWLTPVLLREKVPDVGHGTHEARAGSRGVLVGDDGDGFR